MQTENWGGGFVQSDEGDVSFNPRGWEEDEEIPFQRASEEDEADARRQYDAVVARYTNRDGTKKTGWMRAPNGQPTRLEERQWVQTRTENFKHWFGDWEAARLLQLAERAWNDKDYQDKYAFAPGGALSTRLEELLGHPVSQIVITADSIRHMKNEHGNPSVETPRGQVALTAEDALLLPYLLDHFDVAERSPGHDRPHGERAVEIRKRINGVAVVATVELGKDKQFVVSGWKMVSADSMPRQGGTPSRNVLNDADTANIQRDIAEIKRKARDASRVVDENGEPLVVWHGSRWNPLEEKPGDAVFGKSSTPSQGSYLKDRQGFFFANKEVAEGYGVNDPMAFFINAREPYTVDVRDELRELDYDIETEREEAEAAGYPIGRWLGEGDEEFEANDSATAYLDDNMSEIMERSDENRADAVLVKGADGSFVAVVFDPSQIKSATANVGTFDGRNPDIRFQAAPGQGRDWSSATIPEMRRELTARGLSPIGNAAMLRRRLEENDADQPFRLEQQTPEQVARENAEARLRRKKEAAERARDAARQAKADEGRRKEFDDLYQGRLDLGLPGDTGSLFAPRYRGDGNSGTLFQRVTPEEDAAYLAAVERGDMETARRMVAEAAERAGYSGDNSWRMEHHAPNRETAEGGGAIRMSDAGTDADQLIPHDAWTHPEWYFNMGNPEERESFYAIASALREEARHRAAGDGRHAHVVMYRGVDKTKNRRESAFRNGDWCTPSRAYAMREARNNPGGGRVIEMRVSLANLYWNGDSISEFGYDNGKDMAYADTKNNRKLLDPVTRDAEGNVIPLSKRFDQRNPSVRFQLKGDGERAEESGESGQDAQSEEERGVEEISQRFDAELQQQIDGSLEKGHIYQMGRPSAILRSTGIPDLPIQLSALRLAQKSSDKDHPFGIGEVRGLVKAMQKPVAIFSYGDKSKAQNLIIEISSNGKNFLVGLSLNPQVDGRVLNINSIRNVFPKDTHEWLHWIEKGRLLYADKQKVQALIAQRRIDLADVSYLNLNAVESILRDFQNPQEKNTEKSIPAVGHSNGHSLANGSEVRRGPLVKYWTLC